MAFSALVKRGPAAWQFLYTFLGFALTIEGTVISMINELTTTISRLGVFGAVAVATIYLFLDCGRFQNWLIGVKCRYEGKSR